ncbi:hypothetical protein R3P38DRAFT_2793096 [Favolaschia claudopus]|uniref:Uncharacterized protein n=1 Tax=Favolaschia claudopus TaxID=2862362 RepID=A0AAW0AEC0_9AGAR
MPPRRNKNAPEPAAPLEPEPPTTEPLGQDEVLLNSNQRLDHPGHLNSQLLQQLALRALGKKNEALLDFLIDQALKVLKHLNPLSQSNPPQVYAPFPRRVEQ